VPDSLTVCGMPVELWLRVRAALKDPEAAGVKVTLMAQLAPAATLAPQLLLCAKSLGFAPVSARPLMLKAALPALVNVTDWAELVLPTAWLPKARLVVERFAEGSPTPIPDNEILRER